MKSCAALVLAALGLATEATAQRPYASIGFTTGSVQARSRLGIDDAASSGFAVGGEGRVRLGRVTLDVSYLQSTLKPDTGNAESRDYVEGAALLSVTTVPGVALRVGPHARAYISATGTQRWVFWTVRLSGERALIASAVTGFFELWAAWAAEVNVSEPFDHATGGVVGMSVRIPRSPLYGRLSYGIERATMGDGARLETVEGVLLVVGLGRR